MAGITYTNEHLKCFYCNYLLTVVRSNPECGDNKIKIYCSIHGCPNVVNTQLKLKSVQAEIQQTERVKHKIDKCIEVLNKCIENKGSIEKDL